MLHEDHAGLQHTARAVSHWDFESLNDRTLRRMAELQNFTPLSSTKILI